MKASKKKSTDGPKTKAKSASKMAVKKNPMGKKPCSK